VSYGLIKKIYGDNPSEKIDKAIKANILSKKGNLYRFKTEAIYQAALLLEG